MDASDAAAVLARAQHGDGEAFRVLVERHSRRAFQLAFRMTRNEQDAGDISANRLYRDASTAAGDEMVAAILDGLERNLLELVHGPATLTPAELDQIRLRLDVAALLFRVRVLSDQLRDRESASPAPRNTI